MTSPAAAPALPAGALAAAAAGRPRRIHVGGAVAEDALYIERAADRTLRSHLRAGRSCLVQAPPKSGTSSLIRHTRMHLKTLSIASVEVALGKMADAETPEQWLLEVLRAIGRGLGWDPPGARWEGLAHHAPLADRLQAYFRAELQARGGQRFVVFLDEIDAIDARRAHEDAHKSLLSAICGLVQDGSTDVGAASLTFCLLGTVNACAALAQARGDARWPVDRVFTIPLGDFQITAEEADPLGEALRDRCDDNAALIQRVFYWTDGHPYMTARLCDALQRGEYVPKGSEVAAVGRLVDDLFLRPTERADGTLAAAQASFEKIRGKRVYREMLTMYRRLLAGERPARSKDRQVDVLLTMSGAARTVPDGDTERLRPRNRVFERSFGTAWGRKEKWYKSGRLLKGLGLLGLLLLLMVGFGVRGQHLARQQVSEQRARFVEQLLACERGDEAACIDVRGRLTERCDRFQGIDCLVLGRMHEKAQGGPRDPSLALFLYQRACQAQDGLGCYYQGRIAAGSQHPWGEVMGLYERACTLHEVQGCSALGRMLTEDPRVPREDGRARPLLEDACQKEEYAACAALAKLIDEGRGGLARDPGAAAKLYQRACDKGKQEAEACQRTAEAYMKGLLPGGADPREDALAYYEKGCRLGYAAGCYQQGLLLRELRKDTSRAALVLEQACADLNSAESCNQLGLWLKDGTAGKRDVRLMISLFSKACSMNLMQACASREAVRQQQ